MLGSGQRLPGSDAPVDGVDAVAIMVWVQDPPGDRLADAFAIVSAITWDAGIVTGDPKFPQVEHLTAID